MSAGAPLTAADVAEVVAAELTGARYVPGPGLLGAPWHAERFDAELAELHAALVPPVLLPFRGPDGAIAVHWCVARTREGAVIFFDAARGEFGLAWPGDGPGDGPSGGAAAPADAPAEELDLRGGLVDVFLGR